MFITKKMRRKVISRNKRKRIVSYKYVQVPIYIIDEAHEYFKTNSHRT